MGPQTVLGSQSTGHKAWSSNQAKLGPAVGTNYACILSGLTLWSFASCSPYLPSEGCCMGNCAWSLRDLAVTRWYHLDHEAYKAAWKA